MFSSCPPFYYRYSSLTFNTKVGRQSELKQQDGVTTENDSGIDANTYSNTESKHPHIS